MPELDFCVFKMGKMATQVMAWDYEDGLVPVRDAEDPHDEDTAEDAKLIPRIAIAEGEQARLRLFWQVLYFDTCVVFLRFTPLSLTGSQVHRRYVPKGALHTCLAVSHGSAPCPCA